MMVCLVESAIILFEYLVHHVAKIVFIGSANLSHPFLNDLLGYGSLLEFCAIWQVFNEFEEIVDDIDV